MTIFCSPGLLAARPGQLPPMLAARKAPYPMKMPAMMPITRIFAHGSAAFAAPIPTAFWNAAGGGESSGAGAAGAGGGAGEGAAAGVAAARTATPGRARRTTRTGAATVGDDRLSFIALRRTTNDGEPIRLAATLELNEIAT